MKKVYKIIIGILILALAAGTVTFVVMKKNKRTSVDSKAEQLIARWFDAMTEKDVDGCIGCCFTEALLDSYVKSKDITKEDYTEYIKYQLENSGFKYRKLTVDEKRPLDEDSYYRINEQLSDGEKITAMYEITFSYEIFNEDEWEKVSETVKIMVIKDTKNRPPEKKKHEAGAIIAGIVFMIIIAAATVLVVFNLKGGRYTKEREAATSWLDSMVEGNGEKFVNGSFCEPMMTALVKKNNIEKADYIDAVEQQLKLLDIKYRKLKVVKKGATIESELEDLNAEIAKYTGETNVISDLYPITVKYEYKTGTSSSWVANEEKVEIYVSDGKCYIYSDVLL